MDTEATAVPERARRTVFGLPWPIALPLALMCVAILLVFAARVRLLNLPLERDEGEYAYIGQLMLQGIAPYGVAANMKLPGTSAAYALLMAVFGQSISGIHFGLLLVNLASVVLVFFLARRLFGPISGVPAAACYAVLSVSPNMLGTWAHATHFVLLPALGATLLLLQWVDSQRLRTFIWSGVLFGIAFLMKQPGGAFAIFGGLYLIYSQRKLLRGSVLLVLRNLAWFSAAFLLPFGVTCLLLWWAGVFGKFWFWVFAYGWEYVSVVPFSVGVDLFTQFATPIAEENAGIFLLAATGLVVGFVLRKDRASTAIVAGLLVFSFVAICPGLYFRKHYFILLLPAVALLVGAAAATARATLVRTLPLWAIVGALAYSLWQQSDDLFRLSPLEVSRLEYGPNPFPEAIQVAAYIREHSKRDDRIVVIGSEPEIYFYTARQSVTPYVYVYSMMEPQPYAPQMQADFIRDIETGRPKYVVVVNIAASWLVHPTSSPRLQSWVAPYCEQYYETVGIVNVSPHGTEYKWDADAANSRPWSHSFLLVMRRKGEGT